MTKPLSLIQQELNAGERLLDHGLIEASRLHYDRALRLMRVLCRRAASSHVGSSAYREFLETAAKVLLHQQDLLEELDRARGALQAAPARDFPRVTARCQRALRTMCELHRREQSSLWSRLSPLLILFVMAAYASFQWQLIGRAQTTIPDAIQLVPRSEYLAFSLPAHQLFQRVEFGRDKQMLSPPSAARFVKLFNFEQQAAWHDPGQNSVSWHVRARNPASIEVSLPSEHKIQKVSLFLVERNSVFQTADITSGNERLFLGNLHQGQWAHLSVSDKERAAGKKKITVNAFTDSGVAVAALLLWEQRQ